MCSNKKAPATIRFKCLLILVLSLVPMAPLQAAAPADTMEQRVLPCLACHGETGIDLQSGYVPRLHGKPAGYLYNQLVNYREGRRRNPAMAYMTSHLSNDYLWEMAEYFAGLDVPHPQAAEPLAGEALQARALDLVRRGDPERGIPACQACHGEGLMGVLPNTPSLIGLPGRYIMAQFGAWREGARRAAAPDCMREIAMRMSAQDIRIVSRWIAAQAVPDHVRPASSPVVEPPMECGSVPLPEQ
jgi:cytochrome c553